MVGLREGAEGSLGGGVGRGGSGYSSSAERVACLEDDAPWSDIWRRGGGGFSAARRLGLLGPASFEEPSLCASESGGVGRDLFSTCVVDLGGADCWVGLGGEGGGEMG